MESPRELNWPVQAKPVSSQATPVNVQGKTVVFSRAALQQDGDPTESNLKYPDQPPIVKTAAQFGGRGKIGDDDLDFTIQTDLPGPDRLFERRSEKQLFDRIRMETVRRTGPNRVIFPEEIPVSKDPYVPRQFAQRSATVTPGFVNHYRLYFEQPNFERQGWELGYLQPLVSTGVFYYDTFLFPYHYFTEPHDQGDSNAGKCLPGDPTPLLCYKERFSVSGLLGQGATVTGLFFLLP